MKLIKIFDKLGKQPLHITENTDAIVFVNSKPYNITNIRYESGKLIGFETSSERQWFVESFKPDKDKYVSVIDEKGVQHDYLTWDGNFWWEWNFDSDGADGEFSDISITKWSYI